MEVAARELLDVHVLEREHAHGLHEAVGAVDVPHPDVGHRDLEVEVVLGVAPHDVDLVREVEPALGLDHVLELRNDVAVLAVEGELQFAVVVFEDFVIHGESILESRRRSRSSPRPPQPAGASTYSRVPSEGRIRLLRVATMPAWLTRMCSDARARIAPRGTWNRAATSCSIATGASARVRSTWSWRDAASWSWSRSRRGGARATVTRSRRSTGASRRAYGAWRWHGSRLIPTRCRGAECAWARSRSSAPTRRPARSNTSRICGDDRAHVGDSPHRARRRARRSRGGSVESAARVPDHRPARQ